MWTPDLLAVLNTEVDSFFCCSTVIIENSIINSFFDQIRPCAINYSKIFSICRSNKQDIMYRSQIQKLATVLESAHQYSILMLGFLPFHTSNYLPSSLFH